QHYAEVDRLVGQLQEVERNPATGDYPNEVDGEEVRGDYIVDEKNRKVSF
ncbi:hypothetical protein OSA72_02060, partial [Treponema pallidum]